MLPVLGCRITIFRLGQRYLVTVKLFCGNAAVTLVSLPQFWTACVLDSEIVVGLVVHSYDMWLFPTCTQVALSSLHGMDPASIRDAMV